MSRPLPQRIYLIGMPGSGKSTVGPLLARRLDYAYVDLDNEAERLAGRPIVELFGESEESFRSAERRALESAASRSSAVVATGGGALIDPEARNLAFRTGAVVYLRVPVTTLASRLTQSADRPLLLDDAGSALSADELESRLGSLLSAREATYDRADIVIDARDAPEAVAAAIAMRLGA